MAHGNRRYHIGSLDIGGQFMDAIPCGYEIRPGNCTKRYGRFLGTGTLTRRCQQIFPCRLVRLGIGRYIRSGGKRLVSD